MTVKNAGGAADSTNVNFLKRLATGSALIAVIGAVLFYGNLFVFSLTVTAFIGLALYEFFTLLVQDGIPVSKAFGLIMGISIPVVVYLELGQTQSGEILFLVFGCLFLFILKFFRNNPQSLVGISLTLFGMLYISWFLSFLIKIRFMENGFIWVAYLIAVTKAADIGAFLIGSAVGRHALIPHISPKKSVEGLIGGLCASVLVSYAIRPYLPLDFTPIHIALLGFFIGGVGQIGDLSESLMKRFCHAKDSGGILPGMGGMMDAVDSVLFTAPIFYFHLKTYL